MPIEPDNFQNILPALSDALIGHSGFVGAILSGQHVFPAKFNSRNVEEIRQKRFDTVVCAAAPGSMVEANLAPKRDLDAIEILIEHLRDVEARRFVLISSIAVLADFSGGCDESTQAFEEVLAYGRHRRMLEAFCEDHFESCLVVRLPALFGPGLRKNFIFDLLNPVPSLLTEVRLELLLERLQPELRAVLATLYSPDAATGLLRLDRTALDADQRRQKLDVAVRSVGMAATQFHNADTTYQFYSMSRLWSDIETALGAGLSRLHLAVAPLRAADIHARLLGVPMPKTNAKLHGEDMRTCYAALWDREGPYLEDRDTVMNKLDVFFARHRAAA
ncbi:hypothetical protein AAW00_12800 [Aurantiacibacter luteus]|uniref:NAD-dependent epimerase/dehydratase domain-containing protein n=2 Tax=Aurantiacibacter luteus TaxID=1581420 RepID=A0A0G9MT39_9SPHN|nr:hypothetical protein AAW00_12800 [Aurantiacibacter luteus]